MRPSKLLKLYNRTCTMCNGNFSYFAYPSAEAKRPRKTCSKQCHYMAVSKAMKFRNGKIQKICKMCGTQFLVNPYQKDRIFCSINCYNKELHGRVGDKNPAWKPIDEKKSYRTLKSTIRKHLITPHTLCSDCKRKSDLLEIHHIDKNRDNNKLENLAVLCLDCHAKRHKGERAERLILGGKQHLKNHKRPIVRCEFCNTEFIKYNKNLRFCSHRCARLHTVKIKRSQSMTMVD